MTALTMIDTDILIDVGRGVEEAVDLLRKTQLHDALAISVVTQLELMVGCRNKSELGKLDKFNVDDHMHIITRKRLNDFAEKYPETKSALIHWYQLAKQKDFTSFSELRLMFPNADQVGKLTVFNVGGNKVRLVTAIHYNRKKIYVRAVLTHTEYDQNRWRK